MNRIAAVALVVGLVVGLAACGDAPLQGSPDEGIEVGRGTQLLSEPALTHPSLSPPEAEVFPDMEAAEPVSICGTADDAERSDDEVTSPECGDCPAGFSCAPAFCGGEACVPGRPCTDDADCPSGDCVRPEGAPPSERGMCTTSESCAESRDCALGYQCERGSCVDRRIPCGFHSAGCPRGSICSFMATESMPYCVAANTPCEHSGQCETGAECLDVDGDGSSECSPAGACTSNTDCPAGFSCGIDPGTSQAACVVDGACRDGDCPNGLTCLDTGSGRARCVRTGTCAQDSDCPPRSVCGAVHATDALRCLSFDEHDGNEVP